MSPIALITDFGLNDHFVAGMKAAIIGVNPAATIIDISHGIPPGDVLAAAVMLLISYRDFPKSTIFVVVVDPGVGSDRRAIAVKAGEYYFVGPDNGALSLACEQSRGASRRAPTHSIIRRLENDSFFRKPLSNTFHGRDIFAPTAAHLSKGMIFKEVGHVHPSMIQCTLPAPRIAASCITGDIIHIDHFGNCIATIETAHLNKLKNKHLFVSLKGTKPFPVCSRYSDVLKGKPLGIIGSAGFLEVSIHGGNAALEFKVKRGDRVKIVST